MLYGLELLVRYCLSRMDPYCLYGTNLAYFSVVVPSPTAVAAAVYCFTAVGIPGTTTAVQLEYYRLPL